MRNLGTFTAYVPDLPEDHPLHGHKHVLFLKNGDGLDWYDLHTKIAAGWFAVVNPINNEIEAQSDDLTMLWPIDRILIETDGPIDTTWLWNGTVFVPPNPPVPISFKLTDLVFEDGEHETYKAKHNDVVVAQIQLWPDMQSGEPGAYRMSVRSEYQRRGVMSALVKHVESKIGRKVIPTVVNTPAALAWRAKFEERNSTPDNGDGKIALPPDPPA